MGLPIGERSHAGALLGSLLRSGRLNRIPIEELSQVGALLGIPIWDGSHYLTDFVAV